MDRNLRLETSRLFLHPPDRKDFKQWTSLREASRDHLTPWEPAWPVNANTRQDWRIRLHAWRRGWLDDRSYAFLIRLKETNRLLGGVALTNVRRGSAKTASLGYWLGHDATGQGYMRETVDRLCTWAFEDLGLVRIEAGTVPENTRSQRILEVCGFRKEGLAFAYLEIDGTRRDHVLFSRVAQRYKT